MRIQFKNNESTIKNNDKKKTGLHPPPCTPIKVLLIAEKLLRL